MSTYVVSRRLGQKPKENTWVFWSQTSVLGRLGPSQDLAKARGGGGDHLKPAHAHDDDVEPAPSQEEEWQPPGNDDDNNDNNNHKMIFF